MPTRDDYASQLFAEVYSDLIDAAPVAPSFEEITSNDSSLPRTTSAAWVAVVAAAAVVLVIGMVPLLVNNRPAPVASGVAPTTLLWSSPSTLVELTPTTFGEVGLVPGTWSLVHTVVGGPSGLNSVTVGGPGLVAVGNDEGIVLTSVDGVTWSRVPSDEEVFGGTEMSGVTAGGPGLVAVGSTSDGDISDQDAVVLTSVDGITWSRTPHDEAVFGGSAMSSVTVGGPGLVAVGKTEGGWTDTDAVVWTSVDGIIWSRVPHDESIFGGDAAQSIYDVVAGGPGLVAVGRDGDERPWDNSFGSSAAVWTSVDGVTWSRVPHDESVFAPGGNKLMLSVTVGGPGLVAVGAQSPGGPMDTPAWTSPDGFTWTRVPDDVAVRGVMTGVTAEGPALVAVGLDPSGAGAAWTSVDGITWSQVPYQDARFGRYPDWISDVIVGGPGLVAVGSHDDHATVWVFEAPGE